MDAPALKAAVELTMMPSRARQMRDGPLPAGIPLLLRIAAGDEAAETEAVAALERPIKVVREAATFFIEQMLLHPEADSYRVLGASRTAPTAELRQNMALLMRWLHPDSNREEARAVFVNRVNRAWDDLKTPDRRQAYDLALASRVVRKPVKTNGEAASSRHGAGQRPRSGAVTYRKRELQTRDLLEPLRAQHWGFLTRAFSFFLRAKR